MAKRISKADQELFAAQAAAYAAGRLEAEARKAAKAAAEAADWAARDAEYEASKTPEYRAAEATRIAAHVAAQAPIVIPAGVTRDADGQYVWPASTAAEIAAEASVSLDRQAEQREMVRHMATMD
jgi:septal ring factor EnvC (AmiA/AmiB activator)